MFALFFVALRSQWNSAEIEKRNCISWFWQWNVGETTIENIIFTMQCWYIFDVVASSEDLVSIKTRLKIYQEAINRSEIYWQSFLRHFALIFVNIPSIILWMCRPVISLVFFCSSTPENQTPAISLYFPHKFVLVFFCVQARILYMWSILELDNLKLPRIDISCGANIRHYECQLWFVYIAKCL